MIISFILVTVMFDSRRYCKEKLDASHSLGLSGLLLKKQIYAFSTNPTIIIADFESTASTQGDEGSLSSYPWVRPWTFSSISSGKWQFWFQQHNRYLYHNIKWPIYKELCLVWVAFFFWPVLSISFRRIGNMSWQHHSFHESHHPRLSPVTSP